MVANSSGDDEECEGELLKEEMCDDTSDYDLEAFKAKILERIGEEDEGLEIKEGLKHPILQQINKQVRTCVVISYRGTFTQV